MLTDDSHSARTGAVLASRPARRPDYSIESRILHELSAALVSQPDQILEVLSEKAMALCEAASAGVSLLQGEEEGEPRFFWPAIAGAWSKFTEGGLPRNASPCGKVVDEDATLIFLDPLNDFPVLEGVEPPIKEVLLAPFHAEGRPIGTVWVLAHEGDAEFDRETRRRLESLAAFASSPTGPPKGKATWPRSRRRRSKTSNIPTP